MPIYKCLSLSETHTPCLSSLRCFGGLMLLSDRFPFCLFFSTQIPDLDVLAFLAPCGKTSDKSRELSLSVWTKARKTHLQAPFSLPVSNFLPSLRRIIIKKARLLRANDSNKTVKQLRSSLCCGQLTVQQSDRSSSGQSKQRKRQMSNYRKECLILLTSISPKLRHTHALFAILWFLIMTITRAGFLWF